MRISCFPRVIVQAYSYATQLFTLSYQVCAHENDSFERITRSIGLTWLEILQIIAKGLTEPVIEDVFLKRLNQYLMQITWQTLSKENPLLSHITHVDIDDYILNNIKIHIKDNAWIDDYARWLFMQIYLKG